MQVKSFAIWANAEKDQVPALVQNTLKWANNNNLEVYLADRLKSIDIDSEVSYFSSQNPPEVDFLLCFGGDGTLISGVRIFSDPSVPVLGVPIESKKLKGLDSLLSIAQMPKGVPVGCLAIDGAFNAGILAASIIGNFDTKVKSNLERWRRLQTQSIKKKPK